MKRIFLLVALTLILVPSFACGDAQPTDEVTLQLNWLHEAEFIGYYVADAKGLYEAQNLDVNILEGGPQSPARLELLEGRVTFAICSFAEQRDMTVAGEPAIAVMAAFQIPPLVIFSLTDLHIRQPADLVGKRVGTTTNYWKTVLSQTLTAAGVDPSTVTTVDVKPDQMQMLYDGTVDAWLGYAQDEPIEAEVAGYPVDNIFPADYGIGGYEGLLITLESTVTGDPDLVERFVRASYEGWRYALENQDEAAQILATWAPENSLRFHELAVHAVAPLVDTPQVPVGWIEAARWQQLMGTDFNVDSPGYTMQFSPVKP